MRPRTVDRVRLTRTQSLIWAGQRLHPAVPLANMGKLSRIHGALDPERFVRAFDRVVRSADALRTVIGDGADGPEARILVSPPALTKIMDLGVGELEAWCADRIATPVDATTCAYDSVLLRHGDDDWSWWLDLHHVITDAWSSALVFAATSAAYEGGDAVDLTTIIEGEFAAYARAAGEADDAEAGQERAAAWRDLVPAVNPPIDPYGGRGPVTTRVDRRQLPLPDPALDALVASLDGPYRGLSRELSLLALAATATAATLHRLDGRSTVVMGVPVHHRSGRGPTRLVGPLMEIYPLVLDVDGADSHHALFTRALRGVMTLLRRAKPGESPESDVDVVLNVLTARYGDFAGRATTTEWMRSGHVDPVHAVRLQLYDYGDDLRVELDLNRSLSADGSHRRFPSHLAAQLTAAVNAPDELIGAAPLVSAEERAELALLNPEPEPRADARPVHEQIRDRLRAEPDWIVAEHGGLTLTAGEFDRRADELARSLVRAGLEPGRAVGIRMARGLDGLIALHGVLRAGGVFVLLDPADPAARHDAIVDDADLLLVLDDLRLADEAPRKGEPGVELPAASPDDVAYILYTSGSTGTPKGVPVPHRGLADYLRFAVEAYLSPGERPVVPLHSSLVFDLTITSLFLSFLAGGRLVVFSEPPLEALGRIATDDRLTFLKATPSQLELFARLVSSPRPLRAVVVGGEAFRRSVAERTADCCEAGVRIFNEYGPTEAVVGCMIHEWDPRVDTGVDVPIGRAAPGAEIRVLDAYRQLTPPGGWGELWVRRPGMATGYLGRPELSAERFVDLDDSTGRRWYRTGDRVRVERPGVATFGGRMDDQLKVGGVRLEPAEVEAALMTHPHIDAALVRLWNPEASADAGRRCVRCGLGLDVPGVALDDDGICSVCRSFDAVEAQTAAWFRSPEDLAERHAAAQARRTGEYDCLHLLSGGKDSTYALYQLVDRGWKVHAFTLDTGFLSEDAKDNISRSVADLGISHEFATTDAMNEIFRDSLDRYSNVCQGCYKTIYTLAVARARELGIPVIVTGLSRGQFFETRLLPHQFEAARFDPDEIDRTVLEARRVYHQTRDAVTELLPEQRVFDDGTVLDEIEFVDFYRYVDVELAELYDYLERRAPWVRPADTGRSTNCLINVAGISVHRRERGFHNYAEPYSWDVRLGHKTREEALEELDDEIDDAEVAALLEAVGYRPKANEVLTAWYRSDDGGEIDPDELRAHLRSQLPAHAIPTAFVRIDHLPMAASAKVDVHALPPPTRFHRRGETYEPPTTATEAGICELWAEVLQLERVGADDDFFDLGGDSLGALRVVEAIDHRFGTDLPDAAVFRLRTVHELAAAVDAEARESPMTTGRQRAAEPTIAIDRLPRAAEPSPGQNALLFDLRRRPGSARYGVTRLYRFNGAVDPDGLHDALLAVIAKHDTLRTTFSMPRRELGPEESLDWRVVEDRVVDVDEAAAEQSSRPFDIEHGPLVRATLHRGDTDALVLSLHHLWCDAASFEVLWRDLARAYGGGDVGGLEVRYGDHAAWQQSRVTDADVEAAADLLDGVQGPPTLGLVRPDLPGEDGLLTRTVAWPDADLSPRGRAVFAEFLTAVGLTLGRYTDDPLVVGVPVSVRDTPAADEIVGYFLNTILLPLPGPHRRSADAPGTLGELGVEVDAALASGLRRRTVPTAEVIAARHRRGLPEPLADIMVVHDPRPTRRMPGLDATGTTVFNGDAVTELSLLVSETAAGVEIAAEYSGTRYRPADVEALLDHLAEVFRLVLADPDAPLDGADAVAAPGDLVGAAVMADPPPVTTAIWQHAAVSPDAVAVRQGDEVVTYAALLARAERIAGGLRDRGVVSGDRVGLLLDRSVEQVAAVLAVLRLGAAYVPVDPHYPAARVERVLAVAAPRVVVTGSGPGPRPGGVEDVSIDELVGPSTDELGAMPGLDDPAYVIFTSGSTGVPRGVEVHHRQLAHSTAARAAEYDDAPERFVWTSSYGFDSSIVGLFWTLATGGELVLPQPETTVDIDHLIDVVERAHGTHVLTVPSLWHAVLRRVQGQEGADRLASLRTVIVAGEAVGPDVVAAHVETGLAAELFNEYGPTETTVWATIHCCRPDDDPVPIGRPIAGTVLRVADADLRPRPPGAAGELLIGGTGLTDGYIDDEDATSARFVRDPDGRRWYRSGDLVLRRADDVLEFLGRVDEQISIHGLRVEPEEIERAATACAGLGAAVASTEPGRGGGDALVLHVEPANGAAVDVDAVQSHLRDHLPDALVPRRVVLHDRLPRTVHGKLDRAALRRPTGVPAAAPPSSDTAGQAPPHGSPLDRIVAVWQRVLGDGVDGAAIVADSDFFDEGGTSLDAVELVVAMEAELGVDLTIGVLLNGRTPRGVAALLGDAALVDGSGRAVGEAARTVDRLVELHPGVEAEVSTGRPPTTIVFVPAWDDLFGYAPLADALVGSGSLPEGCAILGLHYRMPSAGHGVRTVPELASIFADDLRAAGRRGPFFVVGWSTSGMVAHELGCLLDQAGHEVTIALVDTYFPGKEKQLWANRWTKYSTLARPGRLGEAGREIAKTVRRRARHRAGRIGRALLRWAEPTAAPPTPRRAIPVSQVIPAEAFEYEAPPTSVPVVMYSASTTPRSRTVDPWRRVAPHLEVVAVEGRHRGLDSVMGSDRVGAIATDIVARLAVGETPSRSDDDLA